MIGWRDVLSGGGLLLALAGAILVFRNSPQEQTVIGGGGADTKFEAFERAARRANWWAKIGIVIGLIGAVMQFASNYVPAPP